MEPIIDFDFDNDTSSDDEYLDLDNKDYYNKPPYNLYKKGREYIYCFSHYSILVPSFEFEKVYGKELDILRNKCKNIKIDENGIKSYTFLFQCSLTTPDAIWKPKCKYLYNDIEFDTLARKFENMINKYADSVPWNAGCEVEDKEWYSESVYDRLNFSVNETKCTIKEYFIFQPEGHRRNPDNYIITKRQKQEEQ
jgi:hypothetical protein